MKKILKEIPLLPLITLALLLFYFSVIAEPKPPSSFLVTYHFQSEYTSGVGSIYLSIKNHKWDEPDRYRTNELIEDALTEDHPEQDFNIVILNIIPLPVKN